MNWTSAMVVATLLIASLPVASAQDDEFEVSYIEGELEWILLGSDNADDNDFQEGTAAEQDQGPLSNDLRALYIAEGVEGDLLFRLNLAAYPDRANDCLGAICQHGYDMTFRLWEYDVELRINYYFGIDGSSDSVRAAAYVEHETPNSWSRQYVGDLEVVSNSGEATFTVTLPRNLITSPSGTLLQAGDTLHSFFVESRFQDESSFASFGLLIAEDRMPDEGTLDTEYITTFGVISSGHLSAYSPLPLRTSNGEATTFLFEVEVTNGADFFDTVRPNWDGGLDSWTVTFPDGNIRLDPGESRSLPFLVTVPFSHVHGEYYPFTVNFQSQADPEASGKLELGVRYTSVPQPAGHHPMLYLHGSYEEGFMNTLEDVSTSESSETTRTWYCNTGGAFGQSIPLQPNLAMGLDFELEEVGLMEWHIKSEKDTEGYSVEGALIVSPTQPDRCDVARGNRHDGTVATIAQTEPMELRSEVTSTFSSVITPTEIGDYVPFNQDNQLWLSIRIIMPDDATSNPECTFGCVAEFFPKWQEGTNMLLPLKEYHDDVDDYFAELSGIDLYAANNTQERFVNPGETIIFRIQATNVGLQQATFDLEMTGTNTNWATLLGDDQIKLKPGEIQEIAVAVKSPSSSTVVDGELADIVLHATLEDDSGIRTIIRLLAEVDTDEDHPDESSAVLGLDEELQTPTALLAVPGGLLLAAIAIRRRP